MGRQTDTHIDSAVAVGTRLREARVRAGLTQQQLSFPGCTTGYVSRLERGERVASLQVLRELASRLDVDECWLATGDAVDKPDETADAELWLRLGELDRAVELFTRLSQDPDVKRRLRGLVGLGQAAASQDDANAAIVWLEQARALDPSNDDPGLIETLGRCHARIGEGEVAIGLFRQALERARERDDLVERQRFGVLLANALLDTGQFDEAAALLGEVIAEAAPSDPFALARIYWSQARLHTLEGETAPAARYGRRALALLEATEHRVYSARAYQMLAHVETDAGNPDAALGALRRGRELFDHQETPHDLATYALEEARALVALGRGEEAVQLAQESAGQYQAGHPVDVGRAYAELARSFAQHDDTARAGELYELAIEQLEGHPNRYLAEAHADYAALLEAEGRTLDALQHYKQAATNAASARTALHR